MLHDDRLAQTYGPRCRRPDAGDLDQPGLRTRRGGTAELAEGRVVLGGRVWDRQHKFRLRLGPTDLIDYCNLLPGGAGIAQLQAAVRNYAGLEYTWDAQLVLKTLSVPPLRLGRGNRLGYTSWLGRRRSDAPAADLILDVDRALKRHVANPPHSSETTR